VPQELVEDRRTGQRLLDRMSEFSQKLCQYVTTDSVARLEADKARMSEWFDSLSLNIDAALNELTDRSKISLKYQHLVDEVQVWLTKAEWDVAELVPKVQLHQDPSFHRKQFQALLMELERNQEKLNVLDQLEKWCGIAEAQRVYDGFSERYRNLTDDLKVC